MPDSPIPATTPVEFYDVPPAFDASLARVDVARPAPSFTDRFFRSPARFWFVETIWMTPLGLFLLQGLLHELGYRDIAAKISDFLTASPHTIMGDILAPVVFPAVAIILAFARIRDAKPGLDRKATIWLAFSGIAGLGVIFLYVLMENFGKFLR